MKNCRGYTLLEVLVVVMMMAVFMVLAIPQFGKFNSSQVLQNTALEFQTALRAAQTNAGNGVKCNYPAAAPSSQWHLSFLDQKRYKVEASCIGAGSGASTVYSLPSGVSFSGVAIEGCTEEKSSFSGYGVTFNNITAAVTYNVPNLSVCTSLALTNAKRTVITLWLDDNHSLIKRIIVEKSGSIYLSS